MADKKEIEKKARQIVADVLGLKAEECLNESLFVDDLGADSLDALDIIIKTEIEFDIALKEGEGDDVKTIRDYLDLVCKKLQHQIQ